MKLHKLLGLGSAFVAAAIYLSPGVAQAETILAVTTENSLITFDSTTPGNITSAYSINGLQGSESIVGIDFWGDTLYALGSSSRLYTLDSFGVATEVGQFGPPNFLNGLAFGFDIDSSGARVIGSGGQQLIIDLGTGSSSVGADVTSGVSGLAYDSTSGQHYTADYVANTIGSVDTASGVVSVIGAAGIDFSRHNGFDISPNSPNTAYLASPATSSGAEANLYIIDLSTGSASLVGLIGNSGDNILIRGLSVMPIPEPSSIAFLLLGVAALFGVRRFQSR